MLSSASNYIMLYYVNTKVIVGDDEDNSLLC